MLQGPLVFLIGNGTTCPNTRNWPSFAITANCLGSPRPATTFRLMGSSATLCAGSDRTLTTNPSLLIWASATACGLPPTGLTHNVYSASFGSPDTNRLYVITVWPLARFLPASFTTKVAPSELNFSPHSTLSFICPKHGTDRPQQTSSAIRVFMAKKLYSVRKRSQYSHPESWCWENNSGRVA